MFSAPDIPVLCDWVVHEISRQWVNEQEPDDMYFMFNYLGIVECKNNHHLMDGFPQWSASISPGYNMPGHLIC